MPRSDDPAQQQLTAIRRAQILNAATGVFATKGFARATIRDVARAAGLADGTIYNYFANKAALLLGILDRMNESDLRSEHFAQAATMDISTFVSTYIEHRLALIDETGLAVLRVLIAELLTDQELRELYYQQIVMPTFPAVEPYFKEWAAQGKLLIHDLQLTPRIFAGMVLGVLVLRLLGDPYLAAHWEAVPQALSTFALDGMLPKGAHNESVDQA